MLLDAITVAGLSHLLSGVPLQVPKPSLKATHLSVLRERLAPCLVHDLAVSFYVLGVGFYL
jgi:hypothetical protein